MALIGTGFIYVYVVPNQVHLETCLMPVAAAGTLKGLDSAFARPSQLSRLF